MMRLTIGKKLVLGFIGLGLAVTRSIIENHKGSIRVSSEVGRGTTLTIELPLNTTKTKGE
jgi:signal transduction histidine kinase